MSKSQARIAKAMVHSLLPRKQRVGRRREQLPVQPIMPAADYGSGGHQRLLRAVDLLRLQRTAGNRQVRRLVAQRTGPDFSLQQRALPNKGYLRANHLTIQRSNPPVVAEPPVRPNAQACLVHLHGDEPNALDVAKALHQRYCVNLTYIDNPGQRLITLDVPGFPQLTCRADPNRIFQDAAIVRLWRIWNSGVRALLRDPARSAAQQAVKDFRDNVLSPKIRQCRAQAVDARGAVAGTGVSGSLPTVAFHNNTNNGGLTIRSYLSGGKEAKATETDSARLRGPFAQIRQSHGSGNPRRPSNPHVQRGEDVDDFILVTDPQDFVNLFRAGRNVVLQSQSPPQDGSLSVVLSAGRYVNVEAQQGRTSNAIQQGMGEQALGSLGVTQCPQSAAVPGQASPTTPSSAPPVRRQSTSSAGGAPQVQRDEHEMLPTRTAPLSSERTRGETGRAGFSALSNAAEDIRNIAGQVVAELNRVLQQVATMPQPLPRETPPAHLPATCRTFSDQAALDARKAHWVSVIAAMPLPTVVNWIIGMRNPPPAVTREVEKQRDCMLAGIAASSRVTLPNTRRRRWQVSGHRGFSHQRRIWQQKFDFTRRTPFDRISDHARGVCGTLLNATETQWNTAEPRHRACWGGAARPGTTLPAMPAGTRVLTPDERQQEILAASSAPGVSRHHWGTDVDLFSDQPTDFVRGAQFADEYAWMMSNAAIYGFVQSFTAVSAFMRLGYMEERWHWSYWPIAQALLEFARAHQVEIQTALTAQWGTSPEFSHISRNWRAYMFNVNETPRF